jgi:putative endonuclease
MFSIYVLYSSYFNRYYIGSTENVVKRIQQHNDGISKSTKAFRPWVLVYQENFETRTEARKRENQIKKFKGGRAFKKLIDSNRSELVNTPL